MTLPKTLAVIAGSAAFAFLPAMAGSATTAEIHKVEISTHGYDLSKPADAQIVLYKISRAAKKSLRPDSCSPASWSASHRAKVS